MSRRDLGILSAILITLIISRIIPHAPNFTSTAAGLIFAGAVLRKPHFSLIILAGYFLCDLLINNTLYASNSSSFQWTSQAIGWIYASLLISFFISRHLSENLESPFKLLGISVTSSLVFYALSNFGVWNEGLLYTRDLSGLITCYIAGIPYLLNEMAASVFFTVIFFLIYWKTFERPSSSYKEVVS
ncbi:MAG: hypothetical protein HOP11_12030 [Saprospiraceae bacterium]|nr:hypothetical protein [Saprospiraceae bacterium]